MIVFLTLIYVAVLFLAVKIGIIKLNSFWKISPVLWMVLLFFVLFVPMQWGAPAGAVRMYESVIEVIPNVNGQVTEVLVEPMESLEKGDVIFKIDPAQYQAAVLRLEADLALAQANLERAVDLMERGVGRQLDVDLYQSQVASTEAQLINARWELDQTEVRAPGDGMVVALSLRPGQRVANLPLRSWVAYVESDKRRLAVGIPQSRLRYVEKGQEVEIVLRYLPGKTIAARVLEVVDINEAAQLQPSGLLPTAPTGADPALPFFVTLQIEDESIDLADIPGGTMGTAAIYTESVSATHIIRRVMVRMEAWMNYIKP